MDGWLVWHQMENSVFLKKAKKWNAGLVHPSFKIDGNKGPEFNNYIIHKMSKNLSDLVVRFNRNTSLHSEEIKKQKNLKKLTSFRKVISRFIKSFFFRQGYKGGKIGFLVAVLNALYPLISIIKSTENDFYP